MKKTLAVLAFFVAAVLAGLFVSSSMASASPVTKEKFMQQERGMPLDTQASEVTGAAVDSPLLGIEPKPISPRPYEMADDNKLFSLAENKMGSECCPSPFSGDRGCICMTDAQKKEFLSRGGNRSA